MIYVVPVLVEDYGEEARMRAGYDSWWQVELQNYEIDDLKEPVSSWIINPRIVVRTADACLQINGLPWQFLTRQFAWVRHPASRFPFHCTLLSPGLEILHLRNGSRILDPLDNLCHRHEVNVIVIGQDLIHPVKERIKELWVVLKPGCMEVETQWGSVLLVMAVKIVVQEVIKLISRQDVWARIYHSAPRQVLVKLRVFPTIQLVHHHLPHGVAAGGTVLQISMAAVRHAEVHGVWPQWWVGEGRRDGWVVEKGLFLHHGKLVVTTHAQVRRPDTHHTVVGKVGKFFYDDPRTGHFLGPVVDGGVTPELLVIVVPEVSKCLPLGTILILL